MKKIVWPGLIAGMVMLVLGLLLGPVFNALFPATSLEYQNSEVFRPWNDPLMTLYFIYPFLLGIALAFIWEKTRKLWPGKNLNEKALNFSAIYWILTNIPGMWITYSSFRVSFVMVVSWSLSSLIEVIGASLVLSRMNK